MICGSSQRWRLSPAPSNTFGIPGDWVRDTCAMLPLQLLIQRLHPGLPQDAVELIHAYAFIEPEVWQCPCCEPGSTYLIHEHVAWLWVPQEAQRGRVHCKLCEEPVACRSYDGMHHAHAKPVVAVVSRSPTLHLQ